MSKIRRRISLALLGTSLLLLGALIGSNVNVSWNPGAFQALPAQASSPAVTVDVPSYQPAGYSSVVKRALPSVVSIASTRVVKIQDEGIFPDNPLFRQFFGDSSPWEFQMPPEQKQRGVGSGVIIDPTGYILTNNHVVDGASQIKVSLSDGNQLQAEVVGTDARTDLALIKVDADSLPALPLADSSRLEVGDIVLAIGNPFGVGQTVTMGIVSATGRGDLGIEDYEDFIQTDAAINPGNSGGALIDFQGNLVGINTAIIARGGGNDGVGFAIPATMARHVVDQLRDHGKVSRGLLGAVIQQVTPEIANALSLQKAQGALVSDLSPSGPAEKAGLRRGDVIVALNGREVPDSRRLRLWIAETAPGTRVELTVLRNGSEFKLPVTLDELSDTTEHVRQGEGSRQGSTRGLSLQDLSPEIRQSLNLPADTRGVVVAGVEPGSVAAEAGLTRGDVIQEVNRKAVADLREFKRLMESTATDSSVLLLVNRGGTTLFVVLPAVTNG